MMYYRYKFTWCGHSWILTSVNPDPEKAKMAALAYVASGIDDGTIELIERTDKYENPVNGD